jgi:hypothetical protein
MKKILFILLVGLLLFSCSKDDNVSSSNGTSPEAALSPATANYMEYFYKPQSMKLEYYPESEWREEANIAVVMPIFSNYDCNSTEYYYPRPSLPDSIRLRYNDYVNYYGDTTYWQRHTKEINGVGCIMPLKSISVVADKDLDEAHPAGTPINDLLDIGYARLYSYIKGGYTPEMANEHQLYSISPLATFEGDFLFPEKSRLIFKKKPAPGKYTFTVTFTFDKDPVSGDSLELAPASIEVEF